MSLSLIVGCMFSGKTTELIKQNCPNSIKKEIKINTANSNIVVTSKKKGKESKCQTEEEVKKGGSWGIDQWNPFQ